MSNLSRLRFNTMADQTPGGEWLWRVILERGDGYQEVLVRRLVLNVPSFSRDDEMPVVGRTYRMACYGDFHVEEGVGRVNASARD